MATSRFTQSHGIVNGFVPTASSYNDGFSGDSVDMALYNHVTAILQFSDSAAGAGIVTVMGGLADAEETAAITFTYRLASADGKSAGADIFSAPVESASLTLVEADVKSGLYVIEWDAQDMVVSNVQYRYATLVLSAAGTAGIAGLIYILSEPRYAKAVMPTAIPTA